MRKKLCLICSPSSYRYDSLLGDEEPILTYFMGYLSSIRFNDYYLFDFHLERATSYDDLLLDDISDYVLSVRESGENVHYVRRIAKKLQKDTTKSVWVYGQVARLRRFDDWGDIQLVHHDETLLAERLGLDTTGATFPGGLTCQPYINRVTMQLPMLRRARANIETTRGCHFGCSFCFINQGRNYDLRWQVRPNEAILADIHNYYSMGIRNVVFYDSEFIGQNSAYFSQKVNLLQSIREQFPGIAFKIYARADTLLAFNQFSLMKKAGLAQAFIGVESLDQTDLDALNKRLRVDDILRCIALLKEHDIYSNLSFITFNRNTTTRTLETNLDAISKLLECKPHLMGVPTFTFSFESNWRDTKPTQRELSKKTYIWHDLRQKEQPKGPALFSVEMEPLMEIYRLLSYEWSKKLVVLNIARDTLQREDLLKVGEWFEGLSVFCLDVMRKHLEYFKQRELTIDKLPEFRDLLFRDISKYYECLPEGYQHLETYESHAKSMNYIDDASKVEDDEYWLETIPL